MTLAASDFDEAYKTTSCDSPRPANKPVNGFVGSYPPVSRPGTHGPFFVNTHLVQPERKVEIAGPVPVRSRDFISQ